MKKSKSTRKRDEVSTIVDTTRKIRTGMREEVETTRIVRISSTRINKEIAAMVKILMKKINNNSSSSSTESNRKIRVKQIALPVGSNNNNSREKTYRLITSNTKNNSIKIMINREEMTDSSYSTEMITDNMDMAISNNINKKTPRSCNMIGVTEATRSNNMSREIFNTKEGMQAKLNNNNKLNMKIKDIIKMQIETTISNSHIINKRDMVRRTEI